MYFSLHQLSSLVPISDTPLFVSYKPFIPHLQLKIQMLVRIFGWFHHVYAA